MYLAERVEECEARVVQFSIDLRVFKFNLSF